MFLNVLTPPQQRLFVDAAHAMIDADGVHAEAELALLDAIRVECDIDADEHEPRAVDTVLSDASEVLDSDTARNAFLLELAGVVVIDGDTADSEVELLKRFAAQLDVGDGRLDEILAFAQRAHKLVRDGRALLAAREGN